MPHLTVHALEHQLAGHEDELITALTDAVVDVYGEWARKIVVVQLIGFAPGRWAVGGITPDTVAPTVSFGIRAGALTRPDGPEITQQLATRITDAVAAVVGDEFRSEILVEFHPQPEEHTAVGGLLVTDPREDESGQTG